FLPQVKVVFDRLKMPYFVTRGNHDMVSRETWKQTWGMETNHIFEKGNTGFILLDNSNEKGEYVCPDLAWFEEKLKAFANKKSVFIFMHISSRKWTKYGIDCPEVNDLIDKMPNVKAVFHGHDHDEDNMKASEEKVNHFWDGHFAGSWGTAYKGYRIVESNEFGSFNTYQYNPTEQKEINNFALTMPQDPAYPKNRN
ncbi:MAG: metallophosphoesterase, partial [Verrucomicrobia bacterium]|nr:metallophosphoesterase [Cytophagales bacterium]